MRKTNIRAFAKELNRFEERQGFRRKLLPAFIRLQDKLGGAYIAEEIDYPLEYHQVGYYALHRALGGIAGAKILHLAPRLGKFMRFTSSKGAECVGVEANAAYVEEAKGIGVSGMVRGDATDLSDLREKNFDAAYAHNFIYALYGRMAGKALAVVEQVHQKLKPGGFFVIDQAVKLSSLAGVRAGTELGIGKTKWLVHSVFDWTKPEDRVTVVLQKLSESKKTGRRRAE